MFSRACALVLVVCNYQRKRIRNGKKGYNEMNAFMIVFQQIILFVIYMSVGVLLVKAKVLDKISLESFSRFVLKLALPLLIFTNTISGVDRSTLFHTLPLLGAAVVMYVFLYLINLIIVRCFKLEGNVKQIYRALGMFGNVGFMGIPILTSVFPDKGIIYVSLFTIVDQMVLWTLGVKLTSPVTEEKIGVQWKKMINPATVAIILSVLLVILQIPIPTLLQSALTNIGSTATPLAMIYLGGVFACMDIRQYISKVEYYGIVLVKMILFPVAFYAILGIFSFTTEIRMTISILAAMPSMSSMAMMAKASGSEGDYAIGGIFVTTVCSIITLPIICWVLQNCGL